MICTVLAPGAPWPKQKVQATLEQRKARAVRRYAALTLSQRVEAELRKRGSITTPMLKRVLEVPQSSLSQVLLKMREVGAVILTNVDGKHLLTLGNVAYHHIRTGNDSKLTAQDIARVLQQRRDGVTWAVIASECGCAYETLRRAVRIREMLL